MDAIRGDGGLDQVGELVGGLWGGWEVVGDELRVAVGLVVLL